MLPAAEDFIREVRDIYSRVDTPEERFKEIQPHLEKLLQDEELREVSKTWPFRNEPERGYIENLLFYEDPDYGFVLNSLLKKPRESRGHCIKVTLLSGSREQTGNLCGVAKIVFPKWPEAIWTERWVHVPQVVPGQSDMCPAERRDVFDDFVWDGGAVFPQISD